MPSTTVSVRSLRYLCAQVSLFLLILAGLLLPEMASAQAAVASAQRRIVSGLNMPVAVAVDAIGNIYIADSSNGRVLKETLSAGSYTQTTIVSGQSSYPDGVAVDAIGNVYIAEDNRLLKETPSGGSYTQSVIANNLGELVGIAVDASGTVYTIETYFNGKNAAILVKETLSAGSYTQSLLQIAGLLGARGMAADGSGNVYIAGSYLTSPIGGEIGRVVKETPSGNGYTQSTIGSGLESPSDIAVDASGNVYIVDSGSNQLFKERLTAAGYVQSVVPTFGAGPLYSVAVDANGNLYFADQNNVYITNDPFVTAAPLSSGDFGTVNVGSTSTSPVSVVFTFGTAGTLGSKSVVTQGAAKRDFIDAGTGTCTAGTAYSAGQTCTIDVNFAPKFAGARYGAAELLDGSGNVLAMGYVQGTGAGPQLSFLPGTQSTVATGLEVYGDSGAIAVDGSGNVYIAAAPPGYDRYSYVVTKETPSAGGYTQSAIPGLWPGQMLVDGSGSFYFFGYGSVVKETPSKGTYAWSYIPLPPPITMPVYDLLETRGIAVDGSGNVYITAFLDEEPGNGMVLKETPSAGSYTESTIVSGLDRPGAIAVDGSGNIYVALPFDGQVMKETLAAGSYEESTIGSDLSEPIGVAVDGSGNVYIADSNNNPWLSNRVLKETLSAGGYTQSTIVSDVVNLSGVAVDGSGNVYFSSYNFSFSSYNFYGLGGWVWKIDFANPPSLSFATTAVGSTSFDSPQTVTMENAGNAPLTFPVPAAGNNPSIAANFSLNSSGGSACPLVTSGGTEGTLAAGASCRLPISFTPNALGAIGGSLVLTDNALNAAAPGYARQSISLSGNSATAVPAALISPAPGSTLSGSAEIFVWSAGAGVAAYELQLGTTGAGSNNIYDSGSTTATSVSVSNLPTSSAKLYARLRSEISGVWQWADYTLTEAYGPSAAAALTSPIPGTTLTSISETFTWTTGSGVTAYEILVGTTGVGSSNIYDSGSTTITLANVSGITTIGATLYVKLISYFNGISPQSVNYTFTEATPIPAALTSPTGTGLTSNSETFAWTAGSAILAYELRVGATGAGSNDIYDSGLTAATSALITNIPANGATVYVQLLSYFLATPTYFANYTFTAGTPTPAVLTTPAPGTALTSSSVSFAWTPGVAVSSYELRVGTIGVGSNNVFDSSSTTANSVVVNGIPFPGNTVYVQLVSNFYGAPAQTANYTFTEAAPDFAWLTSPAVGTTLTGSTQTFAWTIGDYDVYHTCVGTTGLGSCNLYDSGQTLDFAGSVTLSNLPTDGTTVYVFLSANFFWGPGGEAYYAFTASGGPPAPAALTAPTQGTTFTGSSQTFTWSPGIGVTAYELWVGTTGPSSSNVYHSPWLKGTSATVSNIPTNGGMLYARLCSRINGSWQFADYALVESGGPTAPAALTAPTGTTLSGSSQTFTWSAGVGVTRYELRVGTTGAGSTNIYKPGSTIATSATVNNIPTNGGTVYVGLSSEINGVWHFTFYTFLASGGPPIPAALTAPTGTTLAGSSQTFTWTIGSGVSDYQLLVGTTGVGSSNLYHSHWTTATSATVSDIPANGGMVYVRLYSMIDGAWQFTDYTFTEPGTAVPAALTAPTGTTLTGSSQTFTWSAGVGVTRYALRVGTTGVTSIDIYKPGSTLATSATVNNIPTNGGTVYVGLSSEINGVWQYTFYTFLESGGPPVPAVLTAPTGTTLTGPSVSFAWTASSGVSDYELWVGTAGPSTSNVYHSRWLTATSATVGSIPTSGGTVYVRLCSLINGAWQFKDYTFIESGGPPTPAALTSPTGTTLTGSSQTFTWSAGVGVTRYALRLGTTGAGSSNIYSAGSTIATSVTVNNIPTNGGTVYVGLSSEINGVWQLTGYTFNAP